MNFALNCAEKTAISQSSLADVFNSIEPSLPESLFGEDCRRRMRCVAARFPMQLSNFWGFECRLGELERSSDILFEIRKGNPGPVFLAGGEKNPSGIDELCEAGLTWQKLRAFAQNWTNPTHPWNHDIRNLWLEMDLVGGDVQKVLSRPNIFFGPDLKISYERTLELIGELAPMFGRPVSQTYALQEFFDCLPEGARVFQIGFMLNRADDAGIRLCVDKVMEDTETEKIMSWLAKLYSTTRTGPIGAAEIGSLRKVFETVAPLCCYLSFGFNLTKDGVGDAFGVECYEEWLDDDTAQWCPLLDELTRAGLCLPEKAQGVRDYAGVTASPLHKRIVGDTVYLNTYRKIHHLKLTLSWETQTQTQNPLKQAKAYLAVSQPGLPLSMFENPAIKLFGIKNMLNGRFNQ